MFLNFIGSGSALNTALGNNSAYIKKGESLLLIDCGSTTFSQIQHLRLLDDIKNIHVLVTHRHPDHISSLGDLIFYVRYILKANISILTPDSENITMLLGLMGVQEDLYTIIRLDDNYDLENSDYKIGIVAVTVNHVEDMDCYGYILKYNDINIFYSGDAQTIPDRVLGAFKRQEIDYIFQDTCSYDYANNPHMYFGDLCTLINSEDRHRVFCMHYDERFDMAQALQKGFRLVENFGG